MEWDQVSGERTQQALETQQSYETEWDMVNTVSFKKRPFSNTECEFSAFYQPFNPFLHSTELSLKYWRIPTVFGCYIIKTWHAEKCLFQQNLKLPTLLAELNVLYLELRFCGSFLTDLFWDVNWKQVPLFFPLLIQNQRHHWLKGSETAFCVGCGSAVIKLTLLDLEERCCRSTGGVEGVCVTSVLITVSSSVKAPWTTTMKGVGGRWTSTSMSWSLWQWKRKVGPFWSSDWRIQPLPCLLCISIRGAAMSFWTVWRNSLRFWSKYCAAMTPSIASESWCHADYWKMSQWQHFKRILDVIGRQKCKFCDVFFVLAGLQMMKPVYLSALQTKLCASPLRISWTTITWASWP